MLYKKKSVLLDNTGNGMVSDANCVIWLETKLLKHSHDSSNYSHELNTNMEYSVMLQKTLCFTFVARGQHVHNIILHDLMPFSNLIYKNTEMQKYRMNFQNSIHNNKFYKVIKCFKLKATSCYFHGVFTGD
jgi:hypothetical protein